MNSWKALWDLALDAAQDNRFAEAIATLRTIAKRSPKNRTSARENLEARGLPPYKSLFSPAALNP